MGKRRQKAGSKKRIFRGRPRLWAAILVALLLFGHWAYHYAPRFRPANPSGPEAALLDLPWAEAAVWVPYPHQNLPTLEKQAGLVAASGGDVLTLADVETPRLPSFGGMLSPPASSLALATGRQGQLAVAVDIYPIFAAFARLAGRLANNAWLGGGEVNWQGRRVQVGWKDGLWMAGSPDLPTLTPVATPTQEPALLVANIRRPSEPLPAGRYRLRVEGEDLVIRSASAEGLMGVERVETLDTGNLSRAGALLLVIAEGAEARSNARAMALFGQDSEAITELPRAAALHRGEERFKLPAESLLKLAGHKFHSGDVAGYTLLATDQTALQGAALLAGPLASRLDHSSPRELDLWLRLAPAADEMDRLCRGLEKAPFISRRKLRSWQSAERLLRGLSGEHSTLRLEVFEERSLVLRIERRAAAKVN